MGNCTTNMIKISKFLLAQVIVFAERIVLSMFFGGGLYLLKALSFIVDMPADPVFRFYFIFTPFCKGNKYLMNRFDSIGC